MSFKFSKFLIIAFCFSNFQVCTKRQSQESAQVKQTEQPQLDAKIVQRVYNKLVGRGLNAPQIAEIRSQVSNYEELIDHLLQSDIYKQEIFYNLHKKRLLLVPEGTPRFFENSRQLFCGMRWDMESYSLSSNYWDILSSQMHWLPVATNGCFANLRLKEVITILETNDVSDEKFRNCLEMELLPNLDEAGYSSQQDLLESMKTKTDDQKEMPFIFTKDGRNILKAHIKRSYFPDLYSGEPMDDPSIPDAVRKELYDFDISFIPFPRAIEDPLGNDTNNCGYKNLTSDDLKSEVTFPYLFFQVKAPKFAAGVHGTLYYLNRHTTESKNRNLHRGRMLYFNYLCKNISPDAANPDGETPVFNPILDPYFAEEDEPAKSSGNCYSCHSIVQPLGNFFSRLTYGRNFNEESFEGLAAFHRYTEPGIIKPKPGGFWRGTNFISGGNHWGLSGMRDSLSNSKQAQSCLVTSLWSDLAPKEMPILPKERAKAMALFGDDQLAYKSLIKNVFMQDRIKDYYVNEKITPIKLEDLNKCEDPSLVDLNTDLTQVFIKDCGGCHSEMEPIFFKKDGAGVPNFDLSNYTTPIGKAELYKDMFCELAISRRMPPPVHDPFMTESQLDNLACHFKLNIKKLVEQGDVDQSWLNSPCGGIESIED